jgi:UDP-2,3-diacylglucosamine pyrophosphatase LpxH
MHARIVQLSHGVNNVRRALGRPYWPLTEGLKLGIATSARFIEQFEQVAASYALAHGYDGVICGHIHRANLRTIHGITYANTGDWVESCSALAENEQGELKLLRWPAMAGQAPLPAAALVAEPA